MHNILTPDCCTVLLPPAAGSLAFQELGVKTAIALSPRPLHAARCIDMCRMCTYVYTLVSAGLSLPAQHVDESWQSAEFFTNKVGLVCMLIELKYSDDSSLLMPLIV